MKQPSEPVEIFVLLAEALSENKAVRESFKSLDYIHFRDDWHHIPRGTVIFGEQVIYGYPHIGRVLALQAGLKAHFEAPFWAEEKINGFNVRIVKLGDQIVGLTRSGLICPFVTDRLADLMPLEIFNDHPDIVVCAEVAGPENPYLRSSPPFIPEDVQLFVFDLMRINEARFIPYREKQALCGEYDLPTVPHHGYYTADDIEAIRTVILQLHQEGREGLIFKEDSPRDHRAKYVTGSISIDDIAGTSEVFADIPPEYFTNRILRLALFLEEHGLGIDSDVRQALGTALLEGFHRTVTRYRTEHRVYETFRCRFRQRENAEQLLEQFRQTSRTIQIKPRQLSQEGDFWILEFDKIYPSTTGLLGNLLAGGLAFD